MSTQSRRSYLLLMLLMLQVRPWGAAGESNTFKILYQGGSRINGPYVSYGTVHLVTCGSLCTQLDGCWAFTWDVVSQECQLLGQLTSTVTLASAPATLNTYYVAGINNRIMSLTATNYMWPDAKIICEKLGGRLALPRDSSHALIISHALGDDYFLMGMWRENNISVWYNMDGQLAIHRPAWDKDQPNNYFGDETGSSSYYGYACDSSITQLSKRALCEI